MCRISTTSVYLPRTSRAARKPTASSPPCPLLLRSRRNSKAKRRPTELWRYVKLRIGHGQTVRHRIGKTDRAGVLFRRISRCGCEAAGNIFPRNVWLPDERPRLGKGRGAAALARLPTGGDAGSGVAGPLQYVQYSRKSGAESVFAAG